MAVQELHEQAGFEVKGPDSTTSVETVPVRPARISAGTELVSANTVWGTQTRFHLIPVALLAAVRPRDVRYPMPSRAPI